MITIDEKKSLLSCDNKNLNMYSPEAYNIIEQLRLKIGWANKYSYQFTWLGRPIIQLPEDILRTQEVIFQLKPTLIIETGVAHGGSLIFYASLLKLFGEGSVIGIDIEIKEHNKEAILSHDLSENIHLVEGSSTCTDVVKQVKSFIQAEDRVLIFLDSNHSYAHVLKELECYSNMVSVGSYIVATDGIMKDLVGVPGAQQDWDFNNPQQAVNEFLQRNKNFVLENVQTIFNESTAHILPTYWPNAWLRKVK